MRKTKKAGLIIAACMLSAGMTLSASAASYSEWYKNKFGEWPEGNVLDWENDPVYYQYLDEEGELDGYSVHEPNGDYSVNNGVDTGGSSYSSSGRSYYADITDAYWSGSTAKWTISGRASKYQLRLYRDGQRIATKETKNKSVNLSEYLTREGDYYFEVRPYNSSAGGWQDWKDSEDKYFGGGQSSSAGSAYVFGPGQTHGEWKRAADGTGRWWYRHSNGSYTVSSWEQINGKWYYFDPSGWMVTGWINVGGSSYYLGSDGAMLVGYNVIDGVGHYFDTSGRMIS